MRSILFFTFLVSLAKAGLWICIGTLIKSHIETLMAFIVRKPIPEDLIDQHRYREFMNILKWIGILLIIIGIIVAVIGFVTFGVSFRMPTNSFNFNF
jgi:hypothetical protein